MELTRDTVATEAGAVPRDWHVLLVDDLVIETAPVCYGVVQVGKHVQGGVPIVPIKYVKEIDRAPLHRSSPAIEAQYTRSRVEAGDVLISVKGTIGRVGVVPGGFKGNISRELARLRVKPEHSSSYVAHQLEAPATQARIMASVVGTTRLEFSIATLRKFPIAVPASRNEQEAIAEALSDADALIESLEQLIAKKRLIKQGAMQELLTGKRRLPGFEGEWAPTSLGKLGATYGGLAGKTKADFGSGAARYIPFLNVVTNSIIDVADLEAVRVGPGETQNRAARGDLFFNGSSETPEEVGLCAVLTEQQADLYLNSFCFGFRPNPDAEFEGLYLAYFFRGPQGRDLMKSLAQGSTRYNLSKRALLEAEVRLPSPDEQAAIARVLHDMDNELEAIGAKLEKARMIKQGMMHNLLTGKIRLV